MPATQVFGAVTRSIMPNYPLRRLDHRFYSLFPRRPGPTGSVLPPIAAPIAQKPTDCPNGWFMARTSAVVHSAYVPAAVVRCVSTTPKQTQPTTQPTRRLSRRNLRSKRSSRWQVRNHGTSPGDGGLKPPAKEQKAAQSKPVAQTAWHTSTDVTPEDIAKKTAELESLVELLSRTVATHEGRFKETEDVRRLWTPESVEKLHQKLLSVDSALLTSSEAINRWTGRPLVTPAIMVVMVLLLSAYLIFRDVFYEWIGSEGAKVAAETIRDEELVEAVRLTIVGIAESPEAIVAVTKLVHNVMEEQETRDALRDLFKWLLKDSYTQELGVYYFMQLLQDPTVEEYLAEQASEIVRATVTDPNVQMSTGVGAWEAFKYGFTPTYMTTDFWANRRWGFSWTD